MTRAENAPGNSYPIVQPSYEFAVPLRRAIPTPSNVGDGVALTKLGKEAVDSLAKEALGSAGRAEGKAIFKLRLQALFPEKDGA